MIPVPLQDAVENWLAGVEPGTLHQWAEQRENLVPRLERDLGPKRHLVRVMLSRPDQQAIRRATTRDWDQLLSRLVEDLPAQGLILWQHQPWYRQQMTAIQQALVGLLPRVSASAATFPYTAE